MIFNRKKLCFLILMLASECNSVWNFHSLSFCFVHSLPIYFHCCHIANIYSQKKEHIFFANFPLFSFIKCPTALPLFITATVYLPTALSDSIWHCKTSPTKKKKYISQNKNIVYNRLFVIIHIYPIKKNITLKYWRICTY